mmetsp:Transcript_116805/g.371770  ORF Transcript_116805/g.371770 Transcript_116805/m.371770 type:complete len:248 (+) Transcript_116805:414-1157(+)
MKSRPQSTTEAALEWRGGMKAWRVRRCQTQVVRSNKCTSVGRPKPLRCNPASSTPPASTKRGPEQAAWCKAPCGGKRPDCSGKRHVPSDKQYASQGSTLPSLPTPPSTSNPRVKAIAVWQARAPGPAPPGKSSSQIHSTLPCPSATRQRTRQQSPKGRPVPGPSKVWPPKRMPSSDLPGSAPLPKQNAVSVGRSLGPGPGVAPSSVTVCHEPRATSKTMGSATACAPLKGKGCGSPPPSSKTPTGGP